MSEISIDEMLDVSLQTRELFKSDIGYFTSTYIHSDIGQNFFVQDSISFIKKAATVKGLHLQNSPFGQGKLVTVLQGEIIDYIVDFRISSSTYNPMPKLQYLKKIKTFSLFPGVLRMVILQLMKIQ